MPNVEFDTDEQLLASVNKYVKFLEVSPSTEVCFCFWAVHPEDRMVPPGMCRECGHTAQAHAEGIAGLEVHPFRSSRKRLVEQNPLCPVHTKEGLVIGYLKWLAKQ